MKKAMLVYQAGIANVFEVEAFDKSDKIRHAKRLVQGTFSQCEWFARGLRQADYYVKSAHCNMAGDIISQEWDYDLTNAPFNDKFHPVYSKGVFIPDEVLDYYFKDAENLAVYA